MKLTRVQIFFLIWASSAAITTGCTTTTRRANAANREASERTNRTQAADRTTESRYQVPKTGPGLEAGR